MTVDVVLDDGFCYTCVAFIDAAVGNVVAVVWCAGVIDTGWCEAWAADAGV